MKIKLIHTSDLHIDWLFSKFSPQAKKVRRKELLQSLSSIYEIAVKENAAGVMISGDLFHSNKVDRHTLTEVWLKLEKITEKDVKIFIIPGNHDSAINTLLASIGEVNPNIFVFGESLEFVDIIEGLTIYGVPCSKENFDMSPLKKLKKLERSGFHVAMLHGTVKNLPLIENKYGPIEPGEIAESGMDYIALGHYHNYQDVSIGGVKAYYSGSPNNLSFDNTSKRYANIITLNSQKVEVKPVEIPSRTYRLYKYDMTGKGLTDLYRQMEKWRDSEACVKITLEGIIDDVELFSLKNQVTESFRNQFFHLEIEEKTTLIPTEEANEQSIKGIFVKKINQSLNSPGISSEERVVLLEALKAGLMAIEGRRLT